MEEWRIEALRLAAQKAEHSRDILPLAEGFFAFITGQKEAIASDKLKAVQEAIA
jgi:hypothetical protein